MIGSGCLRSRPEYPMPQHSHVVWIPAFAGMTESWRAPWRQAGNTWEKPRGQTPEVANLLAR
jgi:hypothetical protein